MCIPEHYMPKMFKLLHSYHYCYHEVWNSGTLDFHINVTLNQQSQQKKKKKCTHEKEKKMYTYNIGYQKLGSGGKKDDCKDWYTAKLIDDDHVSALY